MDKRQVRRTERYQRHAAKPEKSERRLSKSINKRMVVIVVVTLMVVTLGISQMGLMGIEIGGTSYGSQIESTAKQSLSNQLFGSNLVLLRGRGVKADIITKNGDRVTSVAVTKDFLRRKLVIKARDRQPSLQWQSNNVLYEVDQTGKVTKQVNARNQLPLVIDETNISINEQSQLTSENFISFIDQANSSLKAKINLTPRQYRVRSTTREIIIDTDQKFYLLLDTSRSVTEQIEAAKRVLELAKQKNQLPSQYIDVRIPYKAYYR